jgi:hypothetical protein
MVAKIPSSSKVLGYYTRLLSLALLINHKYSITNIYADPGLILIPRENMSKAEPLFLESLQSYGRES